MTLAKKVKIIIVIKLQSLSNIMKTVHYESFETDFFKLFSSYFYFLKGIVNILSRNGKTKIAISLTKRIRDQSFSTIVFLPPGIPLFGEFLQIQIKHFF